MTSSRERRSTRAVLSLGALGLAATLGCSADGTTTMQSDSGPSGTAQPAVDAGAPSTPVDADSGGASGGDLATPEKPKIWVAAWADAPDTAGGAAGSSQTFREIVKPTVGSRGTVRLHFSNYFGTAPVTLGAVHVGVQRSGAAVDKDVPVTFAGSGSVTIAAGGFATSDEVALSFSYGDLLAVTEYVSGSWTALTKHAQGGGKLVTSYATASNAGDQTGDLEGSHFTQQIYDTFLLNRVDVYGDYSKTIAAFGSSTTDGVASGLDAHLTYPEQFAALLHAVGRDDVAIANVGIAGTLVLGGQATAGVKRFARDVVSLPNVEAVIDYLGANDLRINCVKAQALIDGKQDLIAQAHAAGIKIYVATTAASTFCGAQNPKGFGTRFAEGSGEEAERFAVVDWELGSAQPGNAGSGQAADAIIDFAGALADPSNKSYMLPSLDSGDDIHPNATGYGEMVKAIPLFLF